MIFDVFISSIDLIPHVVRFRGKRRVFRPAFVLKKYVALD